MRVVTWNLWWRFGPWRARRHAITAVLDQLDADVCTLQEVWVDDDGDHDLARSLAARLGHHHVTAASPSPARWQRRTSEPTRAGVANVVLSRYPIEATAVLPLPPGEAADDDDDDDDEGRTALVARLVTPHGTADVFTTHLNSSPAQSAIRCEQVRRLAEFVRGWRAPADLPPVVTGDFNAEPCSDEMRLLGGHLTAPAVPGLVFVDAWRYADPHADGATWDRANPFVRATGEPSARVDYVLIAAPTGRCQWHVHGVGRAGDEPVDGVWPSDHAAVVVDLSTEPVP